MILQYLERTDIVSVAYPQSAIATPLIDHLANIQHPPNYLFELPSNRSGLPCYRKFTI